MDATKTYRTYLAAYASAMLGKEHVLDPAEQLELFVARAHATFDAKRIAEPQSMGELIESVSANMADQK